MKGLIQKWSLVLVILLLVVVPGCSFINEDIGEYPRKEFRLSEPGGAELSIAPGALSQKAEVILEDTGKGPALPTGSPLSPATNEYAVIFDGADKTGNITLTIPLSSQSKISSPADSDRVYAAWAEPFGDKPSLVGAVVEDGLVTIPVIGAGVYQVYSIPSHEALLAAIGREKPLAVPAYEQRTPAWCSPTAMTNLVQFHEGSWPAGGLGSTWGETSNYYLAGKAGQPFDKGYFFHWRLEAGGYPVPKDEKESYTGADFEVIIWNWKAVDTSGSESPGYRRFLFDFFQAYVESYLWGYRSAPRPVAWGSGRESHSRTITGSNGEEFYYNDPGSGSLNQTRSWEGYKDEVISSMETERIAIIDTVIFRSDPRPASERKGVILLIPSKQDGYPGSIALVDGGTGYFATNWHWDGEGFHSDGYYYEDLRGVLTPYLMFGSSFQAFHIDDEVELSYAVRNITDRGLKYKMSVALLNKDRGIFEWVHEADLSVGPGKRKLNNPAGRFSIVNLPPGIYTLMFKLEQSGVIQDVKWVRFVLEEQDLSYVHPRAFLTRTAHCRFGPDTRFDSIMIYEKDTEVDLLGVNQERTWGKFEKEVDGNRVGCWIAISVVDLPDEYEVPIIETPPLPTEEREVEKSDFSCADYPNPNQCNADNRCTWKLANDGSGICTTIK